MIGVTKTIGLRCFLLRPRLVSFADGTLPEPVQSGVEQHLANCPRCTEDVVALREVPAVLRRDVTPVRDEAFWVRQRESIVRAVEASASPRATDRPAYVWWLAPALAAMALLLVVRAWNPTDLAAPAPTTAPALATTSAVGGETIAALVDEPAPVFSEDVASLDDATIASLGASLDEEIGGLSDAGLI
ncbi:MAG: zf-HC2 domain-containing protein [Candidatus Binatia bacterium]